MSFSVTRPSPPPPAPDRTACPSRGTSWLRCRDAPVPALAGPCAGRACRGRGGSGRRGGACQVHALLRVHLDTGAPPPRPPVALGAKRHRLTRAVPTLHDHARRARAQLRVTARRVLRLPESDRQAGTPRSGVSARVIRTRPSPAFRDGRGIVKAGQGLRRADSCGRRHGPATTWRTALATRRSILALRPPLVRG